MRSLSSRQAATMCIATVLAVQPYCWAPVTDTGKGSILIVSVASAQNLERGRGAGAGARAGVQALTPGAASRRDVYGHGWADRSWTNRDEAPWRDASMGRSETRLIGTTSDSVTVTHGNGVLEAIAGGRYEVRSASGELVISRAATSDDQARVTALANGERPESAIDRASVTVDGDDVRIEHVGGWVEAIVDGRYNLTDAAGALIEERAATDDDTARLKAIAAR